VAFFHKMINVTFGLASGSLFAQSGGVPGDMLQLKGLRVTAEITKAGGAALGTARLKIYGMTNSHMNKLSTLGMIYQLVPRNSVTVEAIDENGSSIAFTGTITNAYADFKSMPDVPFHVEAHTALYEATESAPEQKSYKGTIDISRIVTELAGLMDLTPELNGTTFKLHDQTLKGSYREQVKQAIEAAGLGNNWVIDDTTLAIWPKGSSRQTKGAVLISKDTGMKDAPSFTAMGILVETRYNPNIVFGGKVEIKSIYTPANGTYTVYTINHYLEANVPKGGWFSTIGAYDSSAAAPVTL
jgi:hypothetical protein